MSVFVIIQYERTDINLSVNRERLKRTGSIMSKITVIGAGSVGAILSITMSDHLLISGSAGSMRGIGAVIQNLRREIFPRGRAATFSRYFSFIPFA